MKYLEKICLIKFDFLGLKTLTVIDKALEYLRDSGIKTKIIDEKAIYESLMSFKRAGASAIVTYFADKIINPQTGKPVKKGEIGIPERSEATNLT